MKVNKVDLNKVINSCNEDVAIIDLLHYDDIIRNSFNKSNKLSIIENRLLNIINISDRKLKRDIIKELREIVTFIYK